MSTPDKAELQQIAQLVEVNRERLQNIESQVVRLEEVRQEQARAIIALETIPKDGASDAMIPLGGGVQIVADIPSEAGAVVDIGSGIQAEKTREEALEILFARNQELLRLMDSLKSEFDETEKLVIELANQFNDGVAQLQGEETETSTTSAPEDTETQPKRRRRKRGTDLTLDD
ncbi:MAG: prefoldin subunit alpha [Candidatus Thermoplasmatota archaeon]|nr:prefoldin subunit alpha [Candidatus Thermoplasmatota archaeon]MEC9350814.1 prefoldin subunit alpha [Candidatus Thermoplasmatota archaeon]MED6313188.1 prefoldin subunit alpha [Candidatus Thermoplasmatota archaeon]MEE3201532.1 prefoldin subunit alpha [Candidatus Thermoplasmatota archaeon]